MELTRPNPLIAYPYDKLGPSLYERCRETDSDPTVPTDVKSAPDLDRLLSHQLTVTYCEHQVGSPQSFCSLARQLIGE